MGPDVFQGDAGRCRSLVTKNGKPNSGTGELWSEDLTSVFIVSGAQKTECIVIGNNIRRFCM